MTESSLTEKPTSLSLTEEGQIEGVEQTAVVYLCPEGDYQNENFNSVRAHCQRKHRYRIELVNGMVKKIEPAEKRLERPAKREAKPRPIREEGVSKVPDVESQLSNFLVTFGLSSRDSAAICEYLRSFGFDNLVKLNHALSDIGVSLSRRRLIIEAWANARDIRIPPQIARSLTIKPLYRPYQPSYGYEYEEPYPYEYGGYRRPQRGEQQNVLFSVGKELGEVKAIMKTTQPTPPATVNPEVEGLREEVKALREHIAEQEKVASEKRWDRMEQNMEKLTKAQEELSKSQKGFYDVAGQFIPGFQKNVGVIAQAVAPVASMYGRNVAKRYSQLSGEPIPTYTQSPEEPPERERLSEKEQKRQEDTMLEYFVESCLKEGRDPYKPGEIPVMGITIDEIEVLVEKVKKKMAHGTQLKSKTPGSSIVITEEG